MVSVEFSPTERERIAAAVAAAEAKTSAEIVPVVALDSGRYDRAEDAIGVVFGLLALTVVWFVYPPPEPGSWAGPPPTLELVALIVALLVGMSLGSVLASRLPGLRRLAIPPSQMREETERAARALFYDQRIHHTERGDAVLIYISLYERVVCVLPDQQIESQLGQDAIDEVCGVLTAKLREADVTAALEAGIGTLGEHLARALPGDGDDANELKDALVVVR